MVRGRYWIMFLFISCLCMILDVSESTQEQDFARKGHGRQTYFDIQAENIQILRQAKHATPNTELVQQIPELWTNFAFIPQADVESDTQMNDDSNMFQENTQNFQMNPVPLQMMASSGESFSASAQNTSRCLNDLQRILLESVGGKTWALSFLDSAGKPGPSLLQGRFQFLGNYKQCRETVAPDDSSSNSTGFGANYVVVDLILIPLQGAEIKAGLCLPATCSEADIEQILTEGVESTPLNGTVTVKSVQIRDSEREITAATIVSIIVICVIGTLMILGTAFDIIFLQWPKWQLEKQSENDETSVISGKGQGSNGYQAIREETEARNVNVEGAPLLGKPSQCNTRITGKMAQVLVSFSVYTNGSKVLNTSQPPGSLTCINGIRFLSMTWVILGHTFFVAAGFLENQMEMIDLIKRRTFDAISNATVSVDTFFALSGLLTAYVILKEMKKGTWKINWGLVYFHRFWRLTPPYMLSLLLVLGLQRFLGEGELWDKVQPADKEFCENNWWTNLLYINNLVKADEMCFGHSWFLANDMQFFIVSPLMLIPFYFNHYAGLFSCLLFLLTSLITTGVLSADGGWSASLVTLSQLEANMDGFLNYYIKPWCRIGPYVIGILTGYLLVKSNNKVHMKWYTVVIGWAAAIATALAVLYGLHDYIIGETMLTTGLTAFYNAVARTAWSVSVCWVIVACVSGYGGFVNTLLSWSPFVVLGRLTYMAYLIHLCVLMVYMGNSGQLYHIGDLNNIVYFLGILFLSYMTAFVLMLGLESPMIGLEKTFLPQRNTREWSTTEKEEEKKPSTDGSTSHNPSEGNRNIDGETRDGELFDSRSVDRTNRV